MIQAKFYCATLDQTELVKALGILRNIVLNVRIYKKFLLKAC